jgi:hypothetical protein
MKHTSDWDNLTDLDSYYHDIITVALNVTQGLIGHKHIVE